MHKEINMMFSESDKRKERKRQEDDTEKIPFKVDREGLLEEAVVQQRLEP